MKKIIFIVALICLFANGAFAGKKVETSYRYALVYAYSQANSIYEDENIRLEIYNQQLWALNKTQKTIFIDLSQCFVVHNGASTPMFEEKRDEKQASKKGVSTKDDTFITIAPSTGTKQNETSICNMTTGVYGKYTTTETPTGDFSDYDKRLIELINDLVSESIKADPKGKEYKGSVARHLTEDESINNIGASIAYSFSKRSEEWTNVTISTWVSDVIFAPFYVEMPQELTKKEKRGFGVKETSPAILHVKADSPFEFDVDKSPIIVADWEGNYKKGTFSLGLTLVSKTKKPGILASVLTLGYANLLAPLTTTYYKQQVLFDGANADWGKLSYAPSMEKTGQDN